MVPIHSIITVKIAFSGKYLILFSDKLTAFVRFSRFLPITYEECINKEKIMPSNEILS